MGELDWFKDHVLHEEPGYLSRLVTDHALDFIEANKRQPFFLFVSHLALHFPFQGPSDLPHRTVGKIWHDQKYGPLSPKGYKRAYRDMLEEVDDSVGSIVQTLDAVGLRQCTLIVVTSDNGAYSWVGSNGPYRGQKGSLFEGGHRVPAIFNWPGTIPSEETSHATAMTMDLAPTFCSIADVDIPVNVSFDGIDLSDVLFRKAALPRRRLFWRFNNSYTNRHAHAVRDGDWKYLKQTGKTYLFNLATDRGEQTNVAHLKRNLVRELHQSYIAWERDVTTGER